MGLVKVMFLLLVIFLRQVVMGVQGSGLPGRLVQEKFFASFRIQGIQRQGDGKDCAPLPPMKWGVRWACFAIFFLDLGLGEVCFGDACRVFFPAGQSSRRGQCTGTDPF